MKKLINNLMLIGLILTLAGCCCPCGKKMQQQNQQNTEPQAPAPEQKPAD